jgi:hypothetical protein
VWTTLLEKLKGLGGSWPIFTALASFALYFLGYLVLRFQLSTWGVATDLAVLDERYFFAGARFLVYLVSTVPSALLLTSPVLAAWWLLNRWSRVVGWRESWNYALTGVVFAVLFIQLVERKCFQLMNSLLVQRQLEGDEWLKSIVLDPSTTRESLFFVSLIVGVAATGWLLLCARSHTTRRPSLEALLVFLLAVEVLLLPVNYGIMVSTRELPKVANFAPAEAWLVWEGKDKITFLVGDNDPRLVSLPNAEVKKLEITGVDHILRRLFAENVPQPTR